MDRDWDDEEFDLDAMEARHEALEAEFAQEEGAAEETEEEIVSELMKIYTVIAQ